MTKRRILAKQYFFFSKWLYLFSLLVFLFALGSCGVSIPVSNLAFLGFFAVILVASLCMAKGHAFVSLSTSVQMGTIALFFCVFWLCTLRECVVYATEIHRKIALGGSGALVVSVVVWIWIVSRHGRELFSRIKAFLRENIYIFGVIFLFIVCCLDCFTLLFKSDSNTYYMSVVANEGRWNFTLSDISKFQIGYHSTYGYSLLAFLGNYIIRIYGIGIRAVNFAMVIAAILCLNEIIKLLFPRQGKAFYAFVLLLFVCNPLILGIAQEMNTDLPMACFFIWFVWAFLRQYKAYTVFFSCLTCFSKEVGIVLLFGFVAGIYLYRLFTAKETFLRRIVTSLKAHEWLIMYAALLFGVDMMQFNNWTWGQGEAAADTAHNMVNTFQINPQYILIKLQEMFVLNFQWLIPLLFVCLVATAVVKRKKIVLSEPAVGIIISFCCFAGFQLLFFTYPHYRYLIVDAFFFSVFTGGAALFCWKGRLRNVVMAGISLLFLIQSFYSVDIASNLLFRKVSTGNGKIISLAYYSGDPDNPQILRLEQDGGNLSNEVFRDYVQNNRQYTGFEKCFERFMREIGYTEDIGLILSPIYADPYWGDDKWTFFNLFGTLDRESIYWNKPLGQLTYEPSDTPIHWLPSSGFADEFDECKEVWYVEFPYDSDWDFEKYREQFEVEEELSVVLGQWKINAYRVAYN